MATTLKDVLQANGWWLKRGVGQSTRKPTHLLLDGGRAHVPDESDGQFLNEYVLVLARNPGDPPAVVELRTPVFRMFMDVDAKLRHGSTCDFRALWEVIFRESARFFAEVPRLVICTAPVKTDGEIDKHGAHLIWPEVWVKDSVAMAFRDALIPALREVFGDDVFANAWEDIVDACVYKANGLRMPWSVKGRGEGRPYVPTLVVTADGATEVPPVTGVTALRTWVHDLSIRGHGKTPSALQEHVVVPASPPRGASRGGGGGTTQPLEEYEHILPLVDAALPPEFKPQRFTGLFRTPNSVMLRSTSHYCRNLGRAHKSNTVFFVVSRQGVSQKCFCRCETTEGRQYGLCGNFESESFPLPAEAIEALLGAAAAAAPVPKPMMLDPAVATLPTQKTKSLGSLQALLSKGVKSRGAKRFKK
jgi:Herpesviridae UL52/UL70 DNA primase